LYDTPESMSARVLRIIVADGECGSVLTLTSQL
jgi:hypothetical protein